MHIGPLPRRQTHQDSQALHRFTYIDSHIPKAQGHLNVEQARLTEVSHCSIKLFELYGPQALVRLAYARTQALVQLNGKWQCLGSAE